MIINKITTGYVIQQFDTEKQKFVSQEFVAGDEVDWETEVGQPVDMDVFANESPIFLRQGLLIRV
jgi:hypothetical protein